MARAFDESLSYQHMQSNMSSQTSLAGDRTWKTSPDSFYLLSLTYDLDHSINLSRLIQHLLKKPQKPKLSKIKFLSSHGVLNIVRVHYSKLHR